MTTIETPAPAPVVPKRKRKPNTGPGFVEFAAKFRDLDSQRRKVVSAAGMDAYNTAHAALVDVATRAGWIGGSNAARRQCEVIRPDGTRESVSLSKVLAFLLFGVKFTHRDDRGAYLDALSKVK